MHAAMGFVLLPSPCVGPHTWSLVAEKLRARAVIVPTFPEAEGAVAEERRHAGRPQLRG